MPELIRSAPLAFDDNGVFRPQGMILLGLLQASGAKCRRVAWGDHESPQPFPVDEKAALEPAGAKLEAFIDAVISALSTRNDAKAAGWAWLERLIFEGERRGLWRCDRPYGKGFLLDPLMTLIGQLASMLDLRSDYLAWIDGSRPLWRIDRMVAVLAVVAKDQKKSPEERTAFLEELLTVVAPAYAGASSAVEHFDCVIGRLGADFVLNSADPPEFIRTLWDKLRPLRDGRGGWEAAKTETV